MAITGLQHPSSPQTTLQPNGNKVIVRRFQYARDDAWEADMPALNSLDATYGYFRGYRTTNGPAYLTVELIYDSDGTVVNFSPGDGDTEYWAETRGEEVPIEYHPGYLVKWNHNLYYLKKLKQPPTIATFNTLLNANSAGATWDNLTDLETAIAIEAKGTQDLEDWLITKADPGVEAALIKKKIKPGLEFYVRPQRVVVKREYNRQQSDAESALAAVGTLQTPSETFGESGGTWLVMSSDTQYDGKYWVTVTEYWYSDESRKDSAGVTYKGWDQDIYATTTT